MNPSSRLGIKEQTRKDAKEAETKQRRYPLRKQSFTRFSGATSKLFKGEGVEELKIGVLHLRRICKSPPIYEIPKFLSPKDIEYCLSQKTGWSRSRTDAEDGATIKKDKNRSSSSCVLKNTPRIVAIAARCAEICGVLHTNVEPLSMVRYQANQQFGLHHDAGTWDLKEAVALHPASSHRRFTIFCYLNDVPVEAGGATNFPRAGFTYQPRAGYALFWSNVDVEGKPDLRVIHEGSKVVNGSEKYGINCFIHDREISSTIES